MMGNDGQRMMSNDRTKKSAGDKARVVKARVGKARVVKAKSNKKTMLDNELGALPSWELGSLYSGLADRRIEKDLSAARVSARRFSRTYRGKLSELTALRLGYALRDYEDLSERLGRLSSYGFLKHAEDLSDGASSRFRQSLQESLTAIDKELLFFTLELNALSDSHLTLAYGKDKRLRGYRAWITALRRFKPHQLSAEVEEVLSEQALTSRQAWITLYDETEASLRFSIGKRELILSEVLHLLSDKSSQKRKSAAHALGRGLRMHSSLLTTIMNTLAQDKGFDDKRRKFLRPIDQRNLDNRISGEVVDSLSASVRKFYPRLSHRYYRLKASWLGREELDYWDRGAPFPHSDRGDIPWSDARELVLEAYGRFSPAMGKIGERFFARSWIDASPRAGKMSGAFSHPTVPSVHPYILLSYRGKTRDVMTLAHELGHGVHQVLASERGQLLSQTPLTLAETASVFGERLSFDLLLERSRSKVEQRALLAGKIEDMINTVVRQISFLDFERRLHAGRRAGPLSSDFICDLWLDVSRESLGDVFRFDEYYRYYWGYISHFIHAPFYVYSYAFGDCLVNILYALYRDGMPGFADKYLALLSAGGSCDYRDLLSSFGLRVADVDFWDRGLLVIESMIDRLESLIRD